MGNITQHLDRFGGTYWAVQFGPGVTQLAICLSAEEADRVALRGRPDPVVELVAFRPGLHRLPE